MKKRCYIMAFLLASSILTGCGVDKEAREAELLSQQTDEEEFPLITDIEELDIARDNLYEKLKTIPSSREEYSNLKNYLMQYGKSSAMQSDAVSRLLDLQDHIKVSPLYTVDFDQDGAIDIYELLLYNTSPISTNSSSQNVKDGKLATYVSCYVFQNGSSHIMTDPVISNFMDKALQYNNIDADVFIRVNLRLYADEVKSLVIEAVDSEVLGLGNDVTSHPIALMVSGLKNTSTQGNIYFYHKDLGKVENSALVFIDATTGTSGNDLYLERSKEYTSTQNIVYMNRVNVLTYLEGLS